MSWPILGRMLGGRAGEHHSDFYPIATSEFEDALRAAETVYQLAIPQIPREVEVSQALLIYPEVERDAVTITAKDMEELQPGNWLGYNIVDFYIRYLERRLPPEHGKAFYFFPSRFYTQLLQSTAPTRTDPCQVHYEQIRKWSKEVNLFERDYVFIPVLERSHWSLVIVCNLSSLTCAPDEMMRLPCIVHLDPIEGGHGSLEGLIKSYVWEAWMDGYQPSTDKGQFQHQLRALNQMKYIQAEVPHQDNSHDCGLYVLHYIEAFLVESSSPGFSFASSESCPLLTHPQFKEVILSKRRHIHTLILELSGVSQERARKRKAIKHLFQKVQACLQEEACIPNLLTASPALFNCQGFEINGASVLQDSMCAQHHQSSGISKGTDEPLSGPPIGLVEYENRCEHLSLQQQHAEREVLTVGPANCNGPMFEAKHGSTHEDAIDVQYQQPSGISTLDDEPLDGRQLPHVVFQGITESSSDKHHHLEPEEVPRLELFGAVKGKNKRERNMTDEETWVLLLCKEEGGRFCKGSGSATDWNLISKEIGKKLGSVLSADRCRTRYDTLMKAYKTYEKYCLKTGKTFCEITEAERLDLKLATTLSEDWYTTIGKICDKAKSRKRIKANPGECTDLSSRDSLAPSPTPISNGRSFEDAAVVLGSACGTVAVALRNVISAIELSSFNEDLQLTLLNLVQECLLWRSYSNMWAGRAFYLEVACRRLSILQDREPREILSYVFKLWQLKLVKVVDKVFEGQDLALIDLWKWKTCFFELDLFEMISEEVLCKNPHLKTYCTSFPIVEQSFLQHIRVLSLNNCGELGHLDLRRFPRLRSLAIWKCPNFHLVTGWEAATGLGSLEIGHCNAYHDFPDLGYLFSLREISLRGLKQSILSLISWQLSQFSQCANLRSLEIWTDEIWLVIADLENLKELKFLEFLSLGHYDFSSIRGLSGLQALTTLYLRACSLRTVPELGCLKGLTHLDMSWSDVEDVAGVGELHLLIWLDLFNCESLNWLPFMGHLKALVYLDLRGTNVKEIQGREGLISLKTLQLLISL